MAVVGTTIINEWSGSKARGNVREYNVDYQVEVNDPSDGPETVLGASGLPTINNAYAVGNDSRSDAFLQSLEPSRVSGSRLLWKVAAKWSTNKSDANKGKGGTDNNGNPTDNPLEFRDEWEIGPSNVSRPVEWAYYRGQKTAANPELTTDQLPGPNAGTPGRVIDSIGPVTNSAGVVLDPPLEKDVALMLIRITKYRATWPNHDSYNNTINGPGNDLEGGQTHDGTFHLAAPGYSKTVHPFTCKLSVNGSLQFQNLISYWRVAYELLIDEQYGWRFEIPDLGLEALMRAGDDNGRGGYVQLSDIVSGQARLRRLLDNEGNPLTTPILLDGQGKVLGLGSPAVLLVYSGYTERDFTQLGL
jgi:hypothetical protein